VSFDDVNRWVDEFLNHIAGRGAAPVPIHLGSAAVLNSVPKVFEVPLGFIDALPDHFVKDLSDHLNPKFIPNYGLDWDLTERLHAIVVRESHHISLVQVPTATTPFSYRWCPMYLTTSSSRGGIDKDHHLCSGCEKLCLGLVGNDGKRRLCLGCTTGKTLPDWYYHGPACCNGVPCGLTSAHLPAVVVNAKATPVADLPKVTSRPTWRPSPPAPTGAPLLSPSNDPNFSKTITSTAPARAKHLARRGASAEAKERCPPDSFTKLEVRDKPWLSVCCSTTYHYEEPFPTYGGYTTDDKQPCCGFHHQEMPRCPVKEPLYICDRCGFSCEVRFIAPLRTCRVCRLEIAHKGQECMAAGGMLCEPAPVRKRPRSEDELSPQYAGSKCPPRK
jgi:hypothetical protein